jgi:hypothetical protein
MRRCVRGPLNRDNSGALSAPFRSVLAPANKLKLIVDVNLGPIQIVRGEVPRHRIVRIIDASPDSAITLLLEAFSTATYTTFEIFQEAELIQISITAILRFQNLNRLRQTAVQII